MLFVSLKADDCESNHYMPETVSIYIVATEEDETGSFGNYSPEFY